MVDPQQSRRALSVGFALSGLSSEELAGLCVALGQVTSVMLTSMLGSDGPRSAHHHDVVAIALNEHLDDLGMSRPVNASAELHAT